MWLLKNLRSPAEDDNVELLDDGDLGIKYRLGRRWRKYRFLVLALVFLFLAVVVFAIIFAVTKKSNSKGM